MTEQQIKAFRIADNKTAEFADWDFGLLEIKLEGLDDIFTGFDLDDAEFVEKVEENEINEILDVEVIIIEPENPSELEAQFNKLQKEGYNCRISTL